MLRRGKPIEWVTKFMSFLLNMDEYYYVHRKKYGKERGSLE